MAKKKLDIALAKVGMNKDGHPSSLENSEYSHAKNANIETESGDTYNIKNDKSNVLASKFKAGFKVINATNDIDSNSTYFFLVNPTTGEGEFGVIENNQNVLDLSDLAVNCGDCTEMNELSTPLEEITQTELQTYTTLISDSCKVDKTEGFNFNINFPIKKTVIKNEKCGKTIYFTDNYNPPRYINIDKITEYFIQEVVCSEDVELNCADFDKMRIFRLFNIPKITPVSIELGGRLKLGTYEFLIAYCDSSGREITEYFSLTNPIAIFDKNNLILEQKQLDSRTGFAIKLDVTGLDQKFTHYKVAVIQTADIEGAQEYFIEGIHPINDTTVIYSTEHNKKRTSIDNLLQVALHVETSEGVVTANNILYQYGVEFKKEINLQPVVNLMGQFMRWQTSIAPEDLYENGVACSLYKGYNRDEVVPFGIRFSLEGGYQTPIFPFIGRTPKDTELDYVVETDIDGNIVYDENGNPIPLDDNLDVASIIANKGDCNTTDRVRNWQYNNTAIEDPDGSMCEVDNIETVTITEEVTKFCIIDDIATIPAGTLTINSQNSFSSLEDYILDNVGTSEAECGEAYENSTIDICSYIYDDYSAIECAEDPFDGLTCGAVEEVSTSIEIQEIVGEQVTKIEKVFGSEYAKIVPPTVCNLYDVDTSNGNPKRDTNFETTYGLTKVYFRLPDIVNESCLYATTIVDNIVPNNNNSVPNFSNYYGALGKVANLQQSQDIAGCNTYVENFEFNSGTTGSVTIKINGVNYTQSFSVSMASTCSAFFATHKAAIEAQTGGILTQPSSNTLRLSSANIYSEDILYTGDLYVKFTSSGFTNKLHDGALWYKANVSGKTKFIVDISKQKDNSETDNFDGMSQVVRMSIYKSCSADAIFCETINMNVGGIFLFEKSGTDLIITAENGTPYATIVGGWFGAGNMFIAIDNNIMGYDINSANPRRFITTPTKGCYTVTTRGIEYKQTDVTWTSIKLRKKVELKSTCSFEEPLVQSCKVIPYKKGIFAYWESTQTYPDNNELYNSSNLVIPTDSIPLNIKAEFEEAFTDGEVDGEYVWKKDANNKEIVDFTCRNIRHFRMPSNKVAPFMYGVSKTSFSTTPIFPLGVTIDENIINTFLDIAEINGLISKEDRAKVISYEIVRGDLYLQRSIVSSGLLYDVRKYQEKSGGKYVNYANYPYNSYSDDKMNLPFSGEDRTILGEGAIWGISNRNYTFHSPETDYYKPVIPTEMSVEAYMFGQSRGSFDEVKNHPKWTILTTKARELANTLATLEVATEIAITIASYAEAYRFGFSAGTSSGTNINIGGMISAAFASAVAAANSVTRFGKYRYEWLKIFRDLGVAHNFAYYYFSEGHYNYIQTIQTQGDRLRGINVGKYLGDGRYINTNEVTGERLDINNLDREASVFLSTGKFPITYPTAYSDYDKTKFNSSLTYAGENGLSETGRGTEINRNIASPYVALKNYQPEQHGTINSVSWLTTGYVGDLRNPRTDCLSIFGGDTYICRHTLKRKHSQFLVTAMNQPDKTPFNYYFYNNIGRKPLFWVSYEQDKDFDSGGKTFPDIDTDKEFDNKTSSGNYFKPPSKFYLYYYGVPSFLCETRVNTNFRYAGNEYKDQFFPQVGDLGEWTQEKNVPIKTPNKFLYNNTYSKKVTEFKVNVLPTIYNKDEFNCRRDRPNGGISSMPDNSENNNYDPWLIYRFLDIFEFPTNFGKLKDMVGVENEAILARFENTSILYNQVSYTNDDGKNPEKEFTGGASFFERRSASFYNTQLGYGGTQNHTSISCEAGHFHVDAKRGQVLLIPPRGKDMQEISSTVNGKPSGMRHWFKEHLPFKILKTIKNVDTDNNYNGIGISMGWDSRYRRVFITKKDYLPKNNNIVYNNGKFYLEDVEVMLTDETYFTDVSWTVAFSPVLGAWMSFYDFKPNYYINHNSYFQTGINQTADASEFGLWSHGLTNKSYQVYYGKKYSFDVEYPVKEEYATKTLNNVELWTEAKRYHNEYDFAFNPDLTFNKSMIHNNVVCSGWLNLVPQRNNFANFKNYPKTNSNGTQDILITNKDNFKWAYDYFYNRVLTNVRNMPFINYDNNQIEKDTNNSIVKFSGKRVLDRMHGSWFLNRLKYDIDSRFSLTLKFTMNEVEV